MKVLRSIFFTILSTISQEKLRGDLFKQTEEHPPLLRYFVLLLLSLAMFLTGCATTTKLVSPATYKEELSQFLKQEVSIPYQTYPGERLSRDKTAVIAVSSHMMETDKKRTGIHTLYINNDKINFMEDIDKPPKYFQLEILSGQNRLETIVHCFNNKILYYIDTNKLTFNAKAGAIYFLQIYNKFKQPNVILVSFIDGLIRSEAVVFFIATAPLWYPIGKALGSDSDDEDTSIGPPFVWIWNAQTEQVGAGRAPRGWSNDQDSNIE